MTIGVISHPSPASHRSDCFLSLPFHINKHSSFQTFTFNGLCNLMFRGVSLLYLPGKCIYIVTVTDKGDWFEGMDYGINFFVLHMYVANFNH